MVELVGISKAFGGMKVLDCLSMSLSPSECHVLLGTNGSGKTTLARILTGLEKADAGAVRMQTAGRAILVQQDFVVWPHLTVESNVRLGDSSGSAESALRWMQKLGLADLSRSRAGELSHGQKQRMALARALTAAPSVLIFDETFSHMDPQMRRKTSTEVEAMCREAGICRLWITQQASDLLGCIDRVSILDQGQIIQTGTAAQIFEAPVSASVAQLTGVISILDIAAWERLKSAIVIEATGQPESVDVIEDACGGRIGFRPHHFRISGLDDRSPFIVKTSQPMEYGYLTLVRFEEGISQVAGTELAVSCDRHYTVGKAVRIEWTGRKCVF